MPIDRKQKWIDKAFEHFAEFGPDGVHIQKIAKELKDPRTNFYHYFADKEDLWLKLPLATLAINEAFGLGLGGT